MTRKVKEGERAGITCAGNWIIDHVKVISFWPEEDTLTNILHEETGTGGSAYNVLVDLERFGLGIPLSGIGLVGDDPDGARILDELRRLGIDARAVGSVAGVPTAYTDVMTVKDTGRRTFFHNRGANALLAPEHFPLAELRSRVLSLGYLLLLDALDAEDPEHGTRAARVLAAARAEGILTAIDVVSEDSDRFARIVTPSLEHADYAVINEIEAGRTVGRELRPGGRLDEAGMEAAARDLIERGVKRVAVIHAPELSLGLARDGELVRQPGHRLPAGFIQGTAGAGDAFLAGMLAGIHEDWGLARSLRFATAAAASCLRHPTTTAGVGSAAEIWELASTMPTASGAPG
jgi:sugar/nucleoside kinase (ribokinase family)